MLYNMIVPNNKDIIEMLFEDCPKPEPVHPNQDSIFDENEGAGGFMDNLFEPKNENVPTNSELLEKIAELEKKLSAIESKEDGGN